jgi:hypothetical protein
MRSKDSIRLLLSTAVVAAVIGSGMPSASAQDFFASFFGSVMGRTEPPPRRALSYGDEGRMQPSAPEQRAAPSYAGPSGAYCVRTCDGRYFPIAATNEQSRAATCSSLCPASETRVFYGSSIDNARGDNGKPYSSLPNAFKYREQLVQGCTCNGKDSVGLASVTIENDKTIRKGDIVAGENGLIVANRAADRKSRTAVNFSPAPQQIREKFERSQAIASR